MAQQKVPLTTDGGDDEGKSSDPYKNVQPSFSWEGGKCAKNQCIGRVTIGTEFVIEFTLDVHGKTGKSWESILHVGEENGHRSPGIWFHPNSYKLHVRLSDVYDKNKGYDPNQQLQQGKQYRIRLECIDSTVSLLIDGKRKSSAGDVVHLTRFLAPVWCGDPWYDAANATVTNLKIYEP